VILKYENIKKYDIMILRKCKGKITGRRTQAKEMTKTTIKFKTTTTEEKEIVILCDYVEEKITIYSTNQSASKKLLKKLGEPKKTDYIQGEVASMEWEIPFSNREAIRKGLSISNFVTSYISKKGE